MARASLLVMVLVAATLSAPASAITTSDLSDNLREDAASDGAEDVLVRVDEVLSSLSDSSYRVRDQTWNEWTGVYRVDCTGYSNRVLEDAVPEAYDELRDARAVRWPRAVDYYDFFRSMLPGGTRGRWRRPSEFRYARPGDLLVWRYKEPKPDSTGHVMFIVGLPARDSRWPSTYRVRVSDSAKSGHSNDSRGDGSGIGAGDLLIRVNAAGQPVAYAWSFKGYFRTDAYLVLGRARY
jgi:hypothetical protein